MGRFGATTLRLVLVCSAGLLLIPTRAEAAPATLAADPGPPVVGSDDVAAADRAVAAAARVLAGSSAALRPARAALRAADAQLGAARARSGRAVAVAATASRAAAVAQRRLDAALGGVAKAQDDVGELARDAYMQGPYSQLQAVLTATDPGDFAERLEAVQVLSRSYNDRLAALRRARADLERQQAQAGAAAARSSAEAQAASRSLGDATAARTRAAQAAAAVTDLIGARRRALATAREHRATVQAQYQRYRANQRRIAGQTRRATAGAGVPGTSGSLLWPIPGAGTSGGVGWRVHPVYGYRSCHTGADIRGWTGTPIHAAAAGVVAAVTNGGAYGLHTIISHGGGVATMYAHQSRTAVRPGQRVARGQVIGYVGATGWATGPHLHFEVHVGGVPYDPMGWFGGGPKHPVACHRR